MIRGGRRCPGHHVESHDRCDVYASGGESFELRCKAEINLPADWNTVRWYLTNNSTIYNIGNARRTVERSSDSCQANLTSTLSYRHVPWNSDDVTVFCRVEYRHYNTSLMMRKSAEITVCTEGWF